MSYINNSIVNVIHRWNPKLWYRMRPKVFGLLGGMRIFHKQYTPFVIVTLPRSGSNLLKVALDSHPQVIARGEVLNPDELEGNPNRPLLTVRWVYLPYPRRVAAAGFKLMCHHDAEERTAWQWLRQVPDLRVIHLVRENRLRAYLSLQIALKSDRWIELDTKNSGVRPNNKLKVEVDLSAWKQYMQRTDALTDSALTTFSDKMKHRVTYQQLVHDWHRTIQGVQAFLGVDEIPLKPKTEKQNPQSLSQLIANYDEVRNALQGTDYEWMLE